MKHIFFLITVLGVAALNVYADSPRSPFPYVVRASDGSIYFKMFPGPHPGNHSDDFGIAYRIRDKGADVELWRTQGWYSTEVFLSNDGDFLVAMGPWNGGSEQKKEDLAVAFYRKGQLMKRYSTADLIKDKSKVGKSLTHYTWLARDAELKKPYNERDHEAELRIFPSNTFRLKTCDGLVYFFDMTTGEIKDRKL
jgi:hypothetical protein